MTTAQMNLRIDAHVKERGDAALAQAGYSPTQAVRTIWTYAAEHGHEPQAVRSFLQQAESAGNPKLEARIAAKRAALQRVDELRKQMEAVIGPSRHYVEGLSDKELLEEALRERWEERGLL